MNQRELFGFKDLRPKLSLKKVITRERMEEVQKLLDKKDGRGAAEKLRALVEDLESGESGAEDKE